jgi:hypothetical protein
MVRHGWMARQRSRTRLLRYEEHYLISLMLSDGAVLVFSAISLRGTYCWCTYSIPWVALSLACLPVERGGVDVSGFAVFVNACKLWNC